MRPTFRFTGVLGTALFVTACSSTTPPAQSANSAVAPVQTIAQTNSAASGAQASTTPDSQAPPVDTTPIERLRFNQLALRLGLPLFWLSDTNQDDVADPGEIRSLLFYPTEGHWLDGGRFTPEYTQALARIRTEAHAAAPTDERVRLVLQELDHITPTLVATDLTALPAMHREFARRMLHVATLIDGLYALQTGMNAVAPRVRDLEPASQSMFRRNWGPRCLGSTTERNPACTAIPGVTRRAVDVYPASLQSTDTFCATIEQRPDATALLTPFTVVREDGGVLRAVPYSEAYAEPMHAIAAELRTAAEAMTDPAEAALVTYLRAAAQSFENNDWTPADEAWAQMNVRNSRWYVRVGPDETYWEPCSHKAGFHLTLALINRDSLTWQERLTPIQNDMERALAALVRREYRPRHASFHMPDFIDIVVNAGEDRAPFGATVGQSLPNWGPVVAQGRGRTVAMSNLYTDADSSRLRREKAATVLSASAIEHLPTTPEMGLLATILHEATHNLGPAHEYRYRGHTADEAFGGGLASMLEEAKAQSGGLFFVDWVRARGMLTPAQVQQAYTDDIVWALGHISGGMYTATGQRKAYSQLAAIQVGFLLDEGALRWDADTMAADGQHRGALTIVFERMPAAARALMTRMMHIKATNDRAAADALAARYVDGDRVPQAAIRERFNAFTQISFVYAAAPAVVQ